MAMATIDVTGMKPVKALVSAVSGAAGSLPDGDDEEFRRPEMAGLIAGHLGQDVLASRLADYKGVVIIEWPYGGGERGGTDSRGITHLMPAALATVYDAETGRPMLAAGVTVHISPPGLITADVSVYLGADGEIIYELQELNDLTAPRRVAATFQFLVTEMRVRQ